MSDSEPNFDPYHSTLTYAGNGHMEVVCPCRNFQLEHRVENIQYLPLQWATITTVTRDVYREHLSHTHMLSCRLSSQVAIFLPKRALSNTHTLPTIPPCCAQGCRPNTTIYICTHVQNKQKTTHKKNSTLVLS